MARIVSERAAEALTSSTATARRGGYFHKSKNTAVKEGTVQLGGEYVEARVLYLHGNAVAALTPEGQLWVCDGGYQGVTTKERLNALPGVSVHQKNFEWFLNGNEWDGNWTNTNPVPPPLTASDRFRVKREQSLGVSS